MKANEEAFKNVLIFLNLPENEALKNEIADEIPHMAYMLEVDGIILGREDSDEIKRFFEYLYPVTYQVVIGSLIAFFTALPLNEKVLNEYRIEELTEMLEDVKESFHKIKENLYDHRHDFQQKVVMPLNEVIIWKNKYDNDKVEVK